MAKKKTVFLTGATGNMGQAGFRELLKKRDRFHIKVLARPSLVNKRKLEEFEFDPDVTVVWGDLMDYNDVCAGVSGADYVLHVGGMVSPAADYYPERTLEVNITSAQNVVDAVLAQPNADDIKVVYIGSVAQYGDRRPPVHWGRAGDPVLASKFDKYSVSKCVSEKIFTDSGLKHWVSLRQSGILYPGILKALNPTAFHVPVGGVLEWTTIEDSGRLLANVVEDWVPDEFWNRFYNISSGQEYRMTNYEFESRILKALGLPVPEKVFEPQWFALRNFHGMWYSDADVLEEYLHFRQNVPVEEYFKNLKKSLPWYFGLAFLAPAFAVKMYVRKFAFERELGTQWWVQHDPEKLNAYYGSLEEYKSIRSWEQLRPAPLEKNLQKALSSGEAALLEHGWDTSKSIYELTREEIETAANFRGGHFLSELPQTPEKGLLYEWECEHGHKFQASLEYVLLGGGWCSECPSEEMLETASGKNKFISGILTPRCRE